MEKKYPLPTTLWYDEKVDEVRDIKTITTSVVVPGDWQHCWQWKGIYQDVYIRTTNKAHHVIAQRWPLLVCRPIPGDSTGIARQQCAKEIAALIEKKGHNRTCFCKK